MPVEPIASLHDPRIGPYLNLKDRELAREGGRFIAEGEHVVRRLLDSDYPAESVLVSERRLEEIAPLAPAGVPVYAAPAALLNEIVGFKFHSGVLACGRRKPPMPPAEGIALGLPATLMICPEIANAENMGAIIRISAAFGASALVLGEKCCDPFWRQSIRVSMGTIFRLPLLQSNDLLRDLLWLREAAGFELVAAVAGEPAEPLAAARRSERLGILFGNEAQGLDEESIQACHRRVTIPMQLGTDSLNVAVAAAVFLFHFCG